MVINKAISDYFDCYKQQHILSLLEIDRETLEFSFNLFKLKENNWIYAAIDDNNFNQEINKITNLKKEGIKQFVCFDLEQLLINKSLKDSHFYLFDNMEQDWHRILSPFEEYTLWNSAILDINLNLFIIKPWSVGYNLLVAGKEVLVRNICDGDGWLINQKYPIFPV